jgi:hypothetical protein
MHAAVVRRRAQEGAEPDRGCVGGRADPLVHYEQRVGVLRVFFNVEERRASVLVLSVGRKEGAGLWIGGREVRI